MSDSNLDLPKILADHAAWLRGEGGQRADLRDANLSGANLTWANLRGANLSGADLRDANLYDANLDDANLSDANLRDANLCDANLSGANLSDANLSDADLSDANLRGVNLSGAYLSGVNLSGANLSDAKWRDDIIIQRTPLFLDGLDYCVVILDQHLQIGCELHLISEWAAFDNERIARMDGCRARRFWDEHKVALLALAASDGRGAPDQSDTIAA